MPQTIRDLIPTGNLPPDFDPWLDMTLEEYFQNYQNTMGGDSMSMSRAPAIGIGNLLGLNPDNSGMFMDPGADYQSPWDAEGNWTPQSESDILSMQMYPGDGPRGGAVPNVPAIPAQPPQQQIQDIWSQPQMAPSAPIAASQPGPNESDLLSMLLSGGLQEPQASASSAAAPRTTVTGTPSGEPAGMTTPSAFQYENPPFIPAVPSGVPMQNANPYANIQPQPSSGVATPKAPAQTGTGAPFNRSSIGQNPLISSSFIPSQSYGTPGGGGITYDEFGIPQINDITLPDTPLIPTTFDDDFQNSWNAYQNNALGNVGDFYNQGSWERMAPAEMDLSRIPQIQAQTPQSNRALDFLLSGQGFGDDIMSLLRGQATDALTRSAVSERAGAKMAAQRAGLQDSGAGVAMEGQVNRRLSDNVANAQNRLSIENADRGLENLRLGAPMELGRSTNAAQMANQAALQNAANVFSGMQQNVQNAQQASGMNAQNQNSREMARAGAQTGLQGQMANQWGGGAIQNYQNSQSQNASNQINRGLNQAQLTRQRDLTNVNTGENRFGQGLNAVVSLVNGSSPGGLAAAGANAANNYKPNLIPSDTLTNFGDQLMDDLQRRR